jgi:hypothetical protein
MRVLLSVLVIKVARVPEFIAKYELSYREQDREEQDDSE